MDEEAIDKSVVEDLLKKSQQPVKIEKSKEAELSDEDELDKYMAGIEVCLWFWFRAVHYRIYVLFIV